MKVIFNPQHGKAVGFDSKTACFKFLQSIACDGILLNEQMSEECSHLENIMYMYNPALNARHFWTRWWRWLTVPHFCKLQTVHLTSTEVHVMELDEFGRP